jgi:hypothetical protein
MDEFYDLKPSLDFRQEQPKPAVQASHTPITVNVPVRVKNAIQSRFAEKADATVAGVLSMMAEGEVLVIGETDLQRLASVLKERPKNGSHLFGMITALLYERDEAKQIADAAAKDVKAYEGLSVGRVLIDLGAQYGAAANRAQAESLPLRVWVERAMVSALENNWF